MSGSSISDPNYHIERSSSLDDFASTTVIGTFPGYAEGASPAVTSYADTGVRDGVSYAYTIIATAGAMQSAPGTATAITPVAKPTSLGAIAVSMSEIDLAWTDNGMGSYGDQVERSTDGTSYSVISSMPVTSGTFADTSRVEGTHYWYRVSSLAADGSGRLSSPSDPADAWSLPAAPTGLAAAAIASNEVTLAWTNNSQGASSVYIERSDDNGATFNVIDSVDATSATTYEDFSVEGNHAYRYIILASTPDGNVSAISNTGADSTPIAGVTGLTATETSATEIDLSWSPNPADVPNAGGIQVYRSTDNQSWTLVTDPPLDPTSTSYNDVGLTANTHYYYQVRAVDSTDLSSGYSGNALVDAYTLPNAPTGLNATAVSSTEIDLAWTNNGDSWTVYEIDRIDPGSSDYNAIDDTAPGAASYQDMNVSDGNTYSYQIQAISGDGAGSAVSGTAVSATTPLDQPYNVVATPNGEDPNAVYSHSEIDLTWSCDSQNATGYLIERSLDDVAFTPIGSIDRPDETYFADTGLEPSTPYYYQIVTVNDSGFGTVYSLATGAQATTSDGDSLSAAPALSPGSVVIGYGTNDDALIAGDGVNPAKGVLAYYPLAPLGGTLMEPLPELAKVDVTLTISDPTLANVYTQFGYPGEYPPILGEVPQGDGTTLPVSSITFLAWGSEQDLWISALHGSTTPGAIYMTMSFSYDPGYPAASYPLPGPVESNRVSAIGVNFEAPAGGLGESLLTDNNFDSPAAGSSSGTGDLTDPLPPTAALTKIDLVYPPGLAGTLRLAQPATGDGLRLWDSPSQTTLLAFPGASLDIDTATSSLTAIYAEAVGGSAATHPAGALFAEYQEADRIYGPGEFDGESGGSASFSWAAVGLSVDGNDMGDPDATIPVDSDGSDPAPAYATVSMNLPVDLGFYSSTTTVTLTLDSSVAQSVDIYNGVPGVSGSTVIMGKDAGGATSHTFTAGGDNPPPAAVYAVALDAYNWTGAFISMQVQVPAGALGQAGSSGAVAGATQPAIQPAVGGKYRVFLTFDDGPINGTQSVLSGLESQGATATFFVLGSALDKTDAGAGNVNKRKGYLLRMLKDGDLIANHSFWHLTRWKGGATYDNPNRMANEFSQTASLIQKLLGAQAPASIATYARLPTANTWRVTVLGGNNISKDDPSKSGPKMGTTADLLKAAGYQVFGWDAEWDFPKKPALPATVVDPGTVQTPQQMADIIMADLKNGKTAKPNELVLLSHDRQFSNVTNTAGYVAKLIAILKTDGVSFDTLDHY